MRIQRGLLQKLEPSDSNGSPEIGRHRAKNQGFHCVVEDRVGDRPVFHLLLVPKGLSALKEQFFGFGTLGPEPMK
jgi:hypothetical protein